MTLEGEYYTPNDGNSKTAARGRNPHDIGRRILLNYGLHTNERQRVAILMTLEGEYYSFHSPCFDS